MELSVVVATLNDRDALAACLDALAAAAPAAERIVVNGPSADGTSGMVRARDDVDVLLELADRNVNVARNAGAAAAGGGVVAFVDEHIRVGAGWGEALAAGTAEAEVVTGPVRRRLPVGSETSRPEEAVVAGRAVRFFDGGNVAFTRGALDAVDGFDEYLSVGGARDAAHRLAGLGVEVGWADAVEVRREGAGPTPGLGETYRGLGYRLAKNYGAAPRALGHVVRSAGRDAVSAFRSVSRGEMPISRWVGDGQAVVGSGATGVLDGLRARLTDRRPARNPNGISSRDDRVVRRYDWS